MNYDNFLMSEESIWERLVSYADSDPIYRGFLQDPTKPLSDFDKFCITHCRDITNICWALREVREIAEEKGYKEILEKISKILY